MQLSFYFLNAGHAFIPLGEVWFFFSHWCKKSKKIIPHFPLWFNPYTNIVFHQRHHLLFSSRHWLGFSLEPGYTVSEQAEGCPVEEGVPIAPCSEALLLFVHHTPSGDLMVSFFPRCPSAAHLPRGNSKPSLFAFSCPWILVSNAGYRTRIPAFIFSSVDIICYISGARMSDCHPQTDVLLK